MSDAQETIRQAHERNKGNEPPSPLREYDTVSLDEVTTGVQEWLREPFTPEGVLTLLAGYEGIGKGLFAAWENAWLTNGHGSMNVGLFSVEDSLTVQTKPRHEAAGAVLGRVFTLRNRKDPDDPDKVPNALLIDLPGDIEILRTFIDSKSLGLLTIDPLISSFNGRIKVKDEKPVRQVLERLAALAEETKCTIRGTIHFNKAVGMDILDRIMNSKAFSAVSRHTLAMGYDPEDPTGKRAMLVVAKSNVHGIGDAMVFEKRSVGVGVNRRDGTEGTVGYLVHTASRTGVNPLTILTRPQPAEDDPGETTIRDLVKGKPPMRSTDFKEAMDANLIGHSKSKRIEDELRIIRRKVEGIWWVVDADVKWSREGGKWIATTEDAAEEDSGVSHTRKVESWSSWHSSPDQISDHEHQESQDSTFHEIHTPESSPPRKRTIPRNQPPLPQPSRPHRNRSRSVTDPSEIAP